MKKLIALALLMFSGAVSAQTWSQSTAGCFAVSGMQWSTGTTGDAFLQFVRNDKGTGINLFKMGVTNTDWKIDQDFTVKGVATFYPSRVQVASEFLGLKPQNGSDPMLIMYFVADQTTYRLMTQSTSVTFSSGVAAIPMDLVDIEQALEVIYSCETGR